ncbi:MAG: putative oxidoreductase YteT [Dehalococcoidia bacterium]|nr:putative oxidoreductase YteT [Bacillota bacterium]
MSYITEQVRIGVIGVSGRGSMAKHWHHPGGKSIVVAGADVNEKFLGDFKKKMNEKVFASTDYRELLRRDDVDAVAVMSPDFCHEEHAVAALEAGKHVFCEKPLAITIKGCDRILKTWHKSGKHLMVGFNMRYMNIFRCMKEIVDSGVIGEVKAVWVRHFVGHGGEWYYHDWHAKRKNSTSLLLQKASHDFDMVHWISGSYTKRVAAFGSLDFYGGDKPDVLECPACPDKDTCTEFQDADHKTHCVFRKEVNVEDNSVVIMELENGIKATYTQCHFTPDYFRNYTFIGTEGRIENLDDSSKIIVLTRNRSKKSKNLANRIYEVKAVEGGHGGADPSICQDFVDMIVSDREPVATPVAGRMSVSVGCAATESLRAGGKVMEVEPLPSCMR